MTSRTCFALALLLAVPALAQTLSSPPPYFFLIESTIEPADAADWATAVARAATAHAEHPDGNAWGAYRKLTGGPEETIRFFFPLDRMADLDDWEPNRRIVIESLGKKQGRVVLDDLDLATDSADRILSYSAKLSRPWPEFKAPKYAWATEVRVAEGEMAEYAALARRVLKAHEKSQSRGYWVVYGNAIGGDSSVLLYIYGFERFAEVDAWPSRQETLAAAMGEEDAARLAAAMGAISETTTSLWQLEPELSQLAGE